MTLSKLVLVITFLIVVKVAVIYSIFAPWYRIHLYTANKSFDKTYYYYWNRVTVIDHDKSHETDAYTDDNAHLRATFRAVFGLLIAESVVLTLTSLRTIFSTISYQRSRQSVPRRKRIIFLMVVGFLLSIATLATFLNINNAFGQDMGKCDVDYCRRLRFAGSTTYDNAFLHDGITITWGPERGWFLGAAAPILLVMLALVLVGCCVRSKPSRPVVKGSVNTERDQRREQVVLVAEEPPQRAVLGALLIFSITVCTLIGGSVEGEWSGWKAATCMPDKCFCEKPRDTLIRQPSNTWSNMGFVVAGVLALTDLKRPVNPSVSAFEYTVFLCVYGAACVILGLMSGFYHASLTFVGQWFDVEGMYLVISTTLVYQLMRLRKVGVAGFLYTYFGLNIVSGLIQYYLPETRRYLFAALIVVYLYAEFKTTRTLKPNINKKYLLYSALTLLVSFLIWIGDNKRLWCRPDSVFQGHAVWHLLDSVATYFLYSYYRSEERTTTLQY